MFIFQCFDDNLWNFHTFRFWPAFGCAQHPKAGRNTQHPSIGTPPNNTGKHRYSRVSIYLNPKLASYVNFRSCHILPSKFHTDQKWRRFEWNFALRKIWGFDRILRRNWGRIFCGRFEGVGQRRPLRHNLPRNWGSLFLRQNSMGNFRSVRIPFYKLMTSFTWWRHFSHKLHWIHLKVKPVTTLRFVCFKGRKALATLVEWRFDYRMPNYWNYLISIRFIQWGSE